VNVLLLRPTWSGYARFCSVDWVLIFVLAGAALAGSLAVAAAVAAGGSERASTGHEVERAAIWQAGFTPEDLRILAGLAAMARVDLAAAQIEIVLWQADHGIVVTGSRLPPGRLGAMVGLDDGIIGRALAAGRTTVAGVGRPDDPGLVAIAAPIPDADGVAGVIAATATGLFAPTDVGRLEALAAEAGGRLTADTAGIRHAG
jgi:hypothetical protein